METIYDQIDFQKESEKIVQAANRIGEESLRSIRFQSFDPATVVVNTLAVLLPALVTNVITGANVGLYLTPLVKQSYLLDPTYNSVECYPPESERTPLYDEDGCLTRVPFPDELGVSPIDQHGTCGICIED